MLGVETSTEIASAAARTSGGTVCESFNAQGDLTEMLTPLVYRLLSRCNISPKDLHAVVVGSGPGSYTGLRVGMTFASVTSWAAGARYYEVPALLAAGVKMLDKSGTAVVTANAYRGEVYTRVVTRSDDGSIIPGEDQLLTASGLKELLMHLAAEKRSVVTIAGFGCEILEAQGGLPEGITEVGRDAANGALALFETLDALGRDNFAGNPLAVRPLYLRRSSAEIQRENRQSERR